MHDFDKFVDEDKSKYIIKLFNKQWTIKYGYVNFLKLTKIVQTDKSLLANSEVQKLYNLILKIGLPEDLYNQLLEKQERLSVKLITSIVNAILEAWNVKLDDIKKGDLKKK